MTGLWAANIGDIVFIDHVDVNIRVDTYYGLINVDGATTFVTAFEPTYEGKS